MLEVMGAGDFSLTPNDKSSYNTYVQLQPIFNFSPFFFLVAVAPKWHWLALFFLSNVNLISSKEIEMQKAK